MFWGFARGRPRPLAQRQEFDTKLPVVVDRAIEYESKLQFVVHHRLVGACGQVDDGQTAVSEGKWSV
jgi:hypothetical protein